MVLVGRRYARLLSVLESNVINPLRTNVVIYGQCFYVAGRLSCILRRKVIGLFRSLLPIVFYLEISFLKIDSLLLMIYRISYDPLYLLRVCKRLISICQDFITPARYYRNFANMDSGF